jgi:chromosome segregation ATPase
MGAVQAEGAELHRAFKAQGAAVQATKAFISSVDEKLSAQLDDRCRACEAAVSAASSSFQGSADSQGKSLERVAALEPQIRAHDEALQKVQQALSLVQSASASSARDAETSRMHARSELSSLVDACDARVRELETRWPEWVSELRSASRALDLSTCATWASRCLRVGWLDWQRLSLPAWLAQRADGDRLSPPAQLRLSSSKGAS